MLAMCKKDKKICFTGLKLLNENLKEKVFHKKLWPFRSGLC